MNDEFRNRTNDEVILETPLIHGGLCLKSYCNIVVAVTSDRITGYSPLKCDVILADGSSLQISFPFVNALFDHLLEFLPFRLIRFSKMWVSSDSKEANVFVSGLYPANG